MYWILVEGDFLRLREFIKDSCDAFWFGTVLKAYLESGRWACLIQLQLRLEWSWRFFLEPHQGRNHIVSSLTYCSMTWPGSLTSLLRISKTKFTLGFVLSQKCWSAPKMSKPIEFSLDIGSRLIEISLVGFRLNKSTFDSADLAARCLPGDTIALALAIYQRAVLHTPDWPSLTTALRKLLGANCLTNLSCVGRLSLDVVLTRGCSWANFKPGSEGWIIVTEFMWCILSKCALNCSGGLIYKRGRRG